MSFTKHTREIREFASRLGYQVVMTNKNHLKFIHHKGKRLIFTSGTPSDHRAHKNCMKDLERNIKL